MAVQERLGPTEPRRIDEVIPPVEVPEGKVGDWEIQRFTISEEDAFAHGLRSIVQGVGHRAVKAGRYTRLMRGYDTIMSDTPAEKGDHIRVVQFARGHVLVMGLGMGMVVNALLMKPEVTRVTVVEIAEEVVQLVAPYYFEKWGHDRLDIVLADAYEFKVKKNFRFDLMWADIWSTLSTKNLSQMALLSRYWRYHAWEYDYWSRDEVRKVARRFKRMLL